MSQPTRRNFLGTSLGAALAFLASKGLYVTGVKADEGSSLVTIMGLTSEAGLRTHIHGFTATLNLDTGEFSGATTSTLSTGEEESTPHPHNINGTVDPFDFDATLQTSETSGHIHLVRPN